MNKIYSIIIFVLMIKCSVPKEDKSSTVDFTLKCDKIFYSEEQNSEEQIIFQIAYNNPTDYTYILENLVA